jgi:Zn-dependent metalloprotease
MKLMRLRNKFLQSKTKIKMKKIIKYIIENIRLPLLALLTLFIAGSAFGQGGGTPLTPKLQRIAKGGSTREWINFFADSTIKPASIFLDFKDGFELSADDNMALTKVKKDSIGFSHYQYQQYYKNHPVLYGEYIIHQQPDSVVKSGNGRLITGLNLGSNALISERQALDAALQFMNAPKYLWQNAAMENELKRQQKNANATYYPKGDLVYAPNNWNATFKAADYRLTWHFKIYTDGADVIAKDVYVDAATGTVIHYRDIAMNCSGGTGTSAFNGGVSISTQFNSGVYRSLNDCQATHIYVYNCARGSAATTFYTDADNTWSATSQQSAVQAQWGAAETYSYYIGEHSRTSWDDAAGDMIAYNNAVYGSPPTANNACWGCFGNATIFGAGNTTAATDDWNTDDIMGHEFTHGVTQASAGLAYNKESGGLNESFSDIFGEMVESWAEGNCDYLVGADRGAIRSFINPKTYGQPDTYLGTNWYTTTGCTPSGSNDNCGVHTNSGVQNHWFYLLSEGGSGTNDNGEAYNVTGITRFKARLIAYRALTVYLTSSAQYIDARKASLQAAWDLYGQCSQEIISVGDAWHAVGVESQSPAYNITVCGTYPADGTFEQAISVLTGGGTSCSPTITASGTTVYFAARDKVVLLPGFTALNGSNFRAYLEPCSSTRWAKAPGVIMSAAERGLNTNVIPVAPATDQSSAIADQGKQGVTVAPNPFTSSFTLSINSKNNVRAVITMYDAYGAKVKQQSGVNLVKGLNILSLNCSNFASGVYMVEVNFGDAKIVNKVIKAK